jgi:hypothetical protein
MPPRGIIDMLSGQPAGNEPARPEAGPPRGLLAVLAQRDAQAAANGGLLDPRFYQSSGSRIDELPLPGLERFTQRYVEQPVRSLAATTLGLPGDAYLAAAKLMAPLFGERPEDVDRGYGYHVLPTSGDFDRVMPKPPPAFDAGPPETAAGRIAQAGAEGALSVPLTGGGSLWELLGNTAGSVLPQAASEKTDNPYALMAAGVLPFFIGSVKKPGRELEEAAAKLGEAKKAEDAAADIANADKKPEEAQRPAQETKPTRALPGIGDVGKSGFKIEKIDLGRAGDTVVYRNPTETQMKSLAMRDKYNTVRWMRMPDGDVYVWPGMASWHDNMAQLLGFDAISDRGGLLLEDGEFKKLTEMP